VKTLLKLLFLCLGVFIIYYGIKRIPELQNLKNIAKQQIYLEQNNKNNIFPDWKNDDVLSKINQRRESLGLSKLNESEKLSKVAKIRLSVIQTDDDYEGKITGYDRETAVKNAGYDANFIGDLVLLDFYKTNDPIGFWMDTENAKNTLIYSDFKEVGIAIVNNQEKVNIYVLFVSPRPARKVQSTPKVTWGGPELWSAVNKSRVEHGVNPLKQNTEMCTIASIRLNQLLELNKLDGHAGFVPTLERSDLKWIGEKYNVSEYLVQGYNTPEESVTAWLNTLGHKSLIIGGEYVWGCVYAQNTIGVAIAAY